MFLKRGLIIPNTLSNTNSTLYEIPPLITINYNTVVISLVIFFSVKNAMIVKYFSLSYGIFVFR